MYLLIPCCLCLAGLFLWQEKTENYRMAVALKGLASICFVFFGVCCSPGTHIARLIVTGLILGCIADVLLNLRTGNNTAKSSYYGFPRHTAQHG